jgi:putative transposase
LGQRRQSLYYKHKRFNDDELIQSELKRLSIVHVNWGFGLMYGKLRLEGRIWGRKLVYRNYQTLKLNLRNPQKRKKIKRDNPNTISAKAVNEGWSLDFLSDDVVDEKKTRILNVMDEYSRKCLLIDAKKTYKAKALVESLKNLIDTYSKPKYIRCDNGPELISKQLAKFCKKNDIEIRFTQPGKPMQNGLVERLNGTVRTECLNLKVFKTIPEVQQDLDVWWNSYNFGRPHSALKGKTPQMVYKNQEYLQSKLVAA